MGFVVPFGVQPPQCHDEITPNDMFSNITCAWSGAFIIAGGLSIAVWIFIRALSMHLQICWDVMPGKKFFYVAQGVGWGLVAVFFTVCITFTGVSFRFGDVCHVNAAESMKTFWGPLLAIAGAAMVIQLSTFVSRVLFGPIVANIRPDSYIASKSILRICGVTTRLRPKAALDCRRTRIVYKRAPPEQFIAV